MITDDVVFAPPNEPPVTGKAGVRVWNDRLLTQVKTSAIAISDRGVVVAGDWAIERGNVDWTVVPVAGGASIQDQGKFVAIWQRQSDGAGKVSRDIWNSSRPQAGASAK